MNEATIISMELSEGHSATLSIRGWRLYITGLRAYNFTATEILADEIEKTLDMKIKRLEALNG